MTSILGRMTTYDELGQVFRLACQEQDQEKVGALFEEILRLLEAEQLARASSPQFVRVGTVQPAKADC